MPHTQILTGPASTRRLLANLGLAIDEAMLVRKIVVLSDQVQRLKYRPAQADRVRFFEERNFKSGR